MHGAAGQQNAEQLQALWREMHRELVGQSSNATQILVESSGHFIQREQPGVIVTAVRHMLETVRSAR
jgi:pimeloyl-ACP methyl ester carboxylesterase